MKANIAETGSSFPLTRPSPRTVPYYGIANEGSLDLGDEYYDEYEDESDFDLEEALEQLEAAADDRTSLSVIS